MSKIFPLPRSSIGRCRRTHGVPLSLFKLSDDGTQATRVDSYSSGALPTIQRTNCPRITARRPHHRLGHVLLASLPAPANKVIVRLPERGNPVIPNGVRSEEPSPSRKLRRGTHPYETHLFLYFFARASSFKLFNSLCCLVLTSLYASRSLVCLVLVNRTGPRISPRSAVPPSAATIKSKLGSLRVLKAGGYTGINGVAAWMGWPDAPTYPERENQYLTEEIAVLDEVLSGLEKDPKHDLILGHNGSVIATGNHTLHRLRRQMTVVYLAASRDEVAAPYSIVIFRIPSPCSGKVRFVHVPEKRRNRPSSAATLFSSPRAAKATKHSLTSRFPLCNCTRYRRPAPIATRKPAKAFLDKVAALQESRR